MIHQNTLLHSGLYDVIWALDVQQLLQCVSLLCRCSINIYTSANREQANGILEWPVQCRPLTTIIQAFNNLHPAPAPCVRSTFMMVSLISQMALSTETSPALSRRSTGCKRPGILIKNTPERSRGTIRTSPGHNIIQTSPTGAPSTGSPPIGEPPTGAPPRGRRLHDKEFGTNHGSLLRKFYSLFNSSPAPASSHTNGATQDMHARLEQYANRLVLRRD